MLSMRRGTAACGAMAALLIGVALTLSGCDVSNMDGISQSGKSCQMSLAVGDGVKMTANLECEHTAMLLQTGDAVLAASPEEE